MVDDANSITYLKKNDIRLHHISRSRQESIMIFFCRGRSPEGESVMCGLCRQAVAGSGRQQWAAAGGSSQVINYRLHGNTVLDLQPKSCNVTFT